MSNELENLSKEELIEQLLHKEKVIGQYQHIVEAKSKNLTQAEYKINTLQQELDWLRKQYFGSKSERKKAVLENDQGKQLSIFDDPEPEILEKPKQKVSYIRAVAEKQKPVRTELPEHLERVEKHYYPEGLSKEELQAMRELPSQVSEELDLIPAKYVVIKNVYHKYVDAQGVFHSAVAKTGQLLPKSKFSNGMINHLIISKYVNHLPLYRIQKEAKRQGLTLASSSLSGVVAQAVDRLEPLYEALVHQVISRDYLQVDETRIEVMDSLKAKGKTYRGWFWVYHDPVGRQVFFDYHPSRGKQVPTLQLRNYYGILQADAYSGYNDLRKSLSVCMATCMAHVRRKFVAALNTDKAAAEHALNYIEALYAIEAKAREQQLSYEQRQKLRWEESRPILKEFALWMINMYTKCTPDSRLAKAIYYTADRGRELATFLKDGRVEIDNNLIENQIRPIAIGRKNYLFAGSHEAAQRSAVLYSFMANCQLHDVDPSKWLLDVMNKLNGHLINRIEELLPQNWKKNQG